MSSSNRLTWQNVTAPDFSAAVNSQKYASEALDKALGRVSNIVTDFDNNRKDAADAAVLRNAMQYQNADELQKAIASGQLMNGVNPDHVRVDALLKAQAQASNLMALDRDRQTIAASKQIYDFNELRNPQLIEGGRLTNATAQQTLEHNAQNQPITRATNLAALGAQILTNVTSWNAFKRGEESYQANLFAAAEYKNLEDRGLIHDPAAMAQYRATLDPNDPGHAALLSKIDAQFKDSITPIGATGSYTGAALSAPQSGIRAVNGVPGINSPEAGAFYANAVQNNPLLPTFLKGLGMLETGAKNQSTIGNNNFFNIKDVSEKGPRRFDKVEGSNDAYREFATPEEAYAEASTLIARKYPAALTAKTPEEFANALGNGVGGAKYATDPDHAKKVVNMINQELKKAGGTPPPVATTAPATPATPVPAVAGATPAASIPTAAAPAANQLSPENAAILSRVTQQTLGLGQSAGNTAELSSFAAAAADKKTSFAEAGKSIVDAYPGLDRRDVDNMLTQVQAMHPMLRNPAAAAYVINNTPKTSAWYDPFNWGNNIRIDKDAIKAKVAELTKPEAVRTGVLINEVSANIGAKVAEADKKLTATNESIRTLKEQLRNAAPGSARANAIQSEITRLEGKAAEYRNQIDTRAAQEKSLTEEVMRAADPGLFAKQQKEAEQRKEAVAAADAAMTEKTAAPTEPEVRVPSWKRNMTKAEAEELKRYEEFKKRDTRERAEAAKRAEQEAKARTEAETQKEAAAITVDAIRNMTQEQINKINTSRAFSKLTKEQRNALITRHFELRGG